MDIKGKLLELEAASKKTQQSIDQLKADLLQVVSAQLLPQHLVTQPCYDFENLKLLLESHLWPIEYMAKDIDHIAAVNIAETFLPPVEKKRVLDFGCGDGYLTHRIAHLKPKKIIGYDTVEHEWKDDFFTTSWDVVKENGPYDVIILYDVVDHIVGGEQVVLNTLSSIGEVLTPEGEVHIRCHPWTSSQGAHLQTNKGFVHLVFRDQELLQLGIKGIPTIKLIHPLGQYEYWFKTAGFRILRRGELINKPVNTFFSEVKVITNRIKENWKTSHDWNLSQGFHFPPIQLENVDYVLNLRSKH